LHRLRYRWWALPKRLRTLDRALLLLGTLRHLGWTQSVAARLPVDGSGNPVPWYNYAAIAWLSGALLGSEVVFEYGAGHSTLWYAQHAKSVYSVEHDEWWLRRLAPRLPANASVELLEEPTGDPNHPYVVSIRRREMKFDVIVVDGRSRVECMVEAASHLTQSGLIVVDNSDRQRYISGLTTLRELGFLRIDLHGLAPGALGVYCTSIFSQDFGRWLDREPPDEWAPVLQKWDWTP
jgi:hypothetical protein